MVAAAALVEFRRAAHFSRADQEDLFTESARLAVLDEGGHGVVEGAPDRIHAVVHVEVVAVGVHVPDPGVAGMDGDESTACFAEAAGSQEELPDRLGLGGVVALLAAVDLVPLSLSGVAGGVVARHHPGILP